MDQYILKYSVSTVVLNHTCKIYIFNFSKKGHPTKFLLIAIQIQFTLDNSDFSARDAQKIQK